MNKWLDRYESGGLVSKNSLNRNVTCSNCGWSWKLSDGGLDPMTCHKCGGDIKMREGGELDEYLDRGQVNFKDQLYQQNRPVVDATAAPIVLPGNLFYDKTRVVNGSSAGLNKFQLKEINQNLKNNAFREKQAEIENYKAAELFHNNNPVAKLLGTRSAPASNIKPTAKELANGLGAGINEFYDVPGIGIANDFVNPLSLVSKGIISPWMQAPLQAQQSDSYLPYAGAALSTALTYPMVRPASIAAKTILNPANIYRGVLESKLLYNDIATGNSIIPYAWKSPAVNLEASTSQAMFDKVLNSRKFTDAEKAMVREYQYNSGYFTNPGIKQQQFNELIKKVNVEFPKEAVVTRRFFDPLAKDSGGDSLPDDYLNTVFESVEGQPSYIEKMSIQNRPSAFSVGVGHGAEANYGQNRIVLSGRNLKKVQSNFIKNNYEPVPEKYYKNLSKEELTVAEDSHPESNVADFYYGTSRKTPEQIRNIAESQYDRKTKDGNWLNRSKIKIEDYVGKPKPGTNTVYSKEEAEKIVRGHNESVDLYSNPENKEKSIQQLIEYFSNYGFSKNPKILDEREVIGSGFDMKTIGKVKNDIGGYDYIVKPINIQQQKNGGPIVTSRGQWLDEYKDRGEYRGQVPTSDVMQNRVPIGMQQIPTDPLTGQPLTREQISRFMPSFNTQQPNISQGTWKGNRTTKDNSFDPYSRIIEQDPQSEANVGKRMRKDFITKKVPAGVTAAAAIMAAPLAAPIVSSAMSAPLTIGSTILPYVTPATVIGAGFGLTGANKFANDLQSGYYLNPKISKSEKIFTGLTTGLDMLGTPGAVEAIGSHLIAPAYKGALKTGNYITRQTPTFNFNNNFNQKLNNTNRAISEHISGIKTGLFKDDRPFFEKFPITGFQKRKVYKAQDEALNEGVQFIDDWYYGGSQDLHPDIIKKMQEMDPNFKPGFLSDNTSRLIDKGAFGNPFLKTKNILVSTRKGALNKANISDEAKNYIIDTRGDIGGVNLKKTNESITLRNRGLYHVPPSKIKDIVIHEAGHTAQKLGKVNDLKFINWVNSPFDNIQTYDGDFTDYFFPRKYTDEGKLFDEAMTETIPHIKDSEGNIIHRGYRWESSPGELHSELLPARNKLINAYVKQGHDKKEAIDMLRSNPTDDQIDWMINANGLNRFFKETTTPELKRKVIRMLYAGIPATIGAEALNQKQQGGPVVTNRGQWDYPGQTTIIPSNNITMQGVPYPVVGVDNTGHTKMMQPGMNYTFPGQYVTEYPMMRPGGQLPTRYVTDPNDRGFRSYKDSLDAYEYAVDANKRIRATNFANTVAGDFEVRGSEGKTKPYEEDSYITARLRDLLGRPINHLVNSGTGQIMIPETQTTYPTADWTDWYHNGALIFNYKKPVQPVELQQRPVNRYPDAYRYGQPYQRPKVEPKKTSPRMQSLHPQKYNPMPEWEQRLYNGSKLRLNNDDGSYSSHKMMNWEEDGKYYAAPTIVNKNGKLIELSPDDAINYHREHNSAKEFNSDAEAMKYADNGYKDLSNVEKPYLPIPQMTLPQQHGRPVYGPGNTIIGYSNDNMKFNPAYQYTGAPNNQFNLQDKELLNNPELLKQYIYNQDSGYHYKGGGEMIKRADGSYSKRGLWDNIRDNKGSGKAPTKEMLEQERKIRNQYQTGGAVTLNTGGEQHRIYVKSTNRGEGDKGHIMVNHPTMDKGMWDTIDLTQKAGAKTIAQGVAATKEWHRENPYMKQRGGERNNNLKNINLNLPVIRHQEINPLHINGFLANDRNQNLFIGGINPRYQNEDFSVGPYMIGVGNKYFQKFPADMGMSGTYHVNDNFDINMGAGQNNINAGIKYNFANGGYVVRRSHDRKGKTHVVTGPDGTKKYFGDPNMGERGKSKYGKEAFYARHKSNLAKNPYFRAYARATWEEGGEIPLAQNGVEKNNQSYQIQKGDTLSNISTKYNVPLNTLANVNNIQNPNLIKTGNQLSIPKKFDRELKYEEIPTIDNKKIVIDNFSPHYDYIIEGDKTYYKTKSGKTWADISDNNSARTNLLNFINKNNYWGGYGSNEKEKYLNPNIKSSKTLPVYNIPMYDEIFNPKKKVVVTPIKKENNYDQKINPYTITPSDAKKSLYQGDISYGASPIQGYGVNVNTPFNMIDNAFNKIGNLYQTAVNGIKRKYATHTGNDNDFAIQESLIPKSLQQYYSQKIPGDITTIDVPDNSGRQYKQEILPVSNIKFGVRNRGEYKDINTEGLEITSFNPFNNKPLPNEASVLALDPNGNLHTGQYKDFKNNNGYLFSRTFKNNIVDFSESSGKNEYIDGAKSGNPKYKQPKVKVLNDQGKIIDGSLNILVKGDDKKDYYGSIQGGRILFVNPTTKEQYLVAGSVDHIKKKFKELKGDNKYLEAYTLDNGTYSRGLSYKDKKLTKDRLKAYDLENTSGGNGLYIVNYNQPINKYPENYLQTPNVRTTKDDSYKKGHALKNEIKNIVLHHTAYTNPLTNEEEVRKQYMSPGANTSHVVIQENGKRTIYASPEQVTFHAGESKWKNRDNVNDFSIGVEFQGDTNKQPLTQSQIESFIEYYTPIAKKYNLSVKDIITHQMIAPGRKPDITDKEYKKILNYMKSKGYKKQGGQIMAIGGQSTLNPIVKKDNRNWLEFLKN